MKYQQARQGQGQLQGCVIPGCTPRAQLGLMPCFCHLGILNKKSEQEISHFHFVLGPTNDVSGFGQE
jgi:hypothetical protein